jgi:hypothetical protein
MCVLMLARHLGLGAHAALFLLRIGCSALLSAHRTLLNRRCGTPYQRRFAECHIQMCERPNPALACSRHRSSSGCFHRHDEEDACCHSSLACLACCCCCCCCCSCVALLCSALPCHFIHCHFTDGDIWRERCLRCRLDYGPRVSFIHSCSCTFATFYILLNLGVGVNQQPRINVYKCCTVCVRYDVTADTRVVFM